MSRQPRFKEKDHNLLMASQSVHRGLAGSRGWGDLRGLGRGSSNITDNTSACPRKDQGQHHNIITTSQHYDKGYKGRYLRTKSFYMAAAFTFCAGEGGRCYDSVRGMRPDLGQLGR